MLRQQLNTNTSKIYNLQSNVSASITNLSKTTKINKNQNTMYEKRSQYNESPFLPSSSPPATDFLKRLVERNITYNNSTNFSKLEKA